MPQPYAKPRDGKEVCFNKLLEVCDVRYPELGWSRDNLDSGVLLLKSITEVGCPGAPAYMPYMPWHVIVLCACHELESLHLKCCIQVMFKLDGNAWKPLSDKHNAPADCLAPSHFQTLLGCRNLNQKAQKPDGGVREAREQLQAILERPTSSIPTSQRALFNDLNQLLRALSHCCARWDTSRDARAAATDEASESAQELVLDGVACKVLTSSSHRNERYRALDQKLQTVDFYQPVPLATFVQKAGEGCTNSIASKFKYIRGLSSQYRLLHWSYDHGSRAGGKSTGYGASQMVIWT
jgi:hypothetical protein